MEGPRMSQKEYLRKYLSDGADNGKGKKKKKKPRVGPKTVKIIDDDVDLRNMRPIEDGEFDILMNSEDAPQIVGVVDERGPTDFTNKKRWRIIADDGEGNVSCRANESVTEQVKRSTDDSPSRKTNRENSDDYGRNASDSDLSPVRSSKHKNKKAKKKKSSEKKSRESSSERSERRERKKPNREKRSPPSNPNSDSDQSLPRKLKRGRSSDSDQSLPRRSRKSPTPDSDQSPPRRSRRSPSPDADRRISRKSKRSPSPDSDQSLPRRSKTESKNRSRARRHSDCDLSPPRAPKTSRGEVRPKHDSRHEESRHHRDRRSEKGRSSPRRSRWSDDRPRRKSRSPEVTRQKKTLDGITAGLQDARALRIEQEKHKRREADMFKKMDAESSGMGQSAVFRDRKTGRRRDFAAEEAERREKEKRQEEIDEKYAKWGKGLKQVQEMAEKRAQDLYEMSKPLARYANDTDLDKALREADREGDPMLEEIQKRQIKEGKRKPEAPSYQGSYAPNRFGIKPGHRWDGVDRSNGYEKKWFESRNARTALQEEAYKWSTADM